MQHQFDGGYWARNNQWDPMRAAMKGSSYFKLPTMLRWFSSNTGNHHIHHLGPRIPNYHLKQCFDAIPELHAKKPLTLKDIPMLWRGLEIVGNYDVPDSGPACIGTLRPVRRQR